MKFVRRWFVLLIFSLFFSIGLHAAEYKVALRANRGVDVGISQWQATMDVLGEQLPQHTFTLVPILDLDGIMQGAARGAFDFILTNPSSC